MKKRDYLVIVWVISAIVFGFFGGRISKKLPEPVAMSRGIDTVKIQSPADTVRDTVHDVKWYPKLKRDTVWLASGSPASVTIDTQRCFDFSTTTPDSVTVLGTACSRDFPIRKPLDLTVDISKITPSRTVKEIITIRDTAFFEKPHLWRDIKIGCMSFGIGAAAATTAIILIGR